MALQGRFGIYDPNKRDQLTEEQAQRISPTGEVMRQATPGEEAVMNAHKELAWWQKLANKVLPDKYDFKPPTPTDDLIQTIRTQQTAMEERGLSGVKVINPLRGLPGQPDYKVVAENDLLASGLAQGIMELPERLIGTVKDTWSLATTGDITKPPDETQFHVASHIEEGLAVAKQAKQLGYNDVTATAMGLVYGAGSFMLDVAPFLEIGARGFLKIFNRTPELNAALRRLGVDSTDFTIEELNGATRAQARNLLDNPSGAGAQQFIRDVYQVGTALRSPGGVAEYISPPIRPIYNLADFISKPLWPDMTAYTSIYRPERVVPGFVPEPGVPFGLSVRPIKKVGVGEVAEELKPDVHQGILDYLKNTFGRTFESATRTQIIEAMGRAIAGETQKYITEAPGVMNKVSLPQRGFEWSAIEARPDIFGTVNTGAITDSFVLINDKEVVKQLVDQYVNEFAKTAATKFARATDTPYEEAFKEAVRTKNAEIAAVKGPEWQKLIPEDPGNRAYIQGYSTGPGFISAIISDGVTQIELNANKLAFVRKYFPDAEMRIINGTSPVQFRVGGEVKALIMPLRDGAKKAFAPRFNVPLTQKEIVAQTVAKEAKNIQQIEQETGIKEPNIRRILGVGTKEGVFERLGPGVYRLRVNGQDMVYVYNGDTLDILPKLADQGVKGDMFFLDIPYKTGAVKGGNKPIAYISEFEPEHFRRVVQTIKRMVRSVDTPIIHMFSQAASGMKNMQKYNQVLYDEGFKLVARGNYVKTSLDDKPVGFNTPSGIIYPEGVLLLTQSGKFPNRQITDADLQFRFVRPRTRQHEKAAGLLKRLIELTTEQGDMIFDPFAGTGVAGEQAIVTGRKATLIEAEAKAVEEHIIPRIEAAGKFKVTEAVRTIDGKELGFSSSFYVILPNKNVVEVKGNDYWPAQGGKITIQPNYEEDRQALLDAGLLSDDRDNELFYDGSKSLFATKKAAERAAKQGVVTEPGTPMKDLEVMAMDPFREIPTEGLTEKELGARRIVAYKIATQTGTIREWVRQLEDAFPGIDEAAIYSQVRAGAIIGEDKDMSHALKVFTIERDLDEFIRGYEKPVPAEPTSIEAKPPTERVLTEGDLNNLYRLSVHLVSDPAPVDEVAVEEVENELKRDILELYPEIAPNDEVVLEDIISDAVGIRTDGTYTPEEMTTSIADVLARIRDLIPEAEKFPMMDAVHALYDHATDIEGLYERALATIPKEVQERFLAEYPEKQAEKIVMGDLANALQDMMDEYAAGETKKAQRVEKLTLVPEKLTAEQRVDAKKFNKFKLKDALENVKDLKDVWVVTIKGKHIPYLPQPDTSFQYDRYEGNKKVQKSGAIKGSYSADTVAGIEGKTKLRRTFDVQGITFGNASEEHIDLGVTPKNIQFPETATYWLYEGYRIYAASDYKLPVPKHNYTRGNVKYEGKDYFYTGMETTSAKRPVVMGYQMYFMSESAHQRLLKNGRTQTLRQFVDENPGIYAGPVNETVTIETPEERKAAVAEAIRARPRKPGAPPEKPIPGKPAEVTDKMITRAESYLLRQRFLNQARGARIAAQVERRAGRLMEKSLRREIGRTATRVRRTTREEILKDLRVKLDNIAGIKQDIVDYTKANLPLAERGRLLNIVKNAHTQRALIKAYARIDEIARRVEKKELIGNIKGLLSQIQESDLVAVDYKAQIRELVGGIEFAGHRVGTLEKLNGIREYIRDQKAAGRDVFMPQEILKKLEILGRIPAVDMSVGELKAVLSGIEALKALGTAKQKTIRALYELEQNKIKEEIFKTIVPIEKNIYVNAAPGERRTTGQRITNAYRKLLNGAQHIDLSLTPMDVVFDMADGSPGTYDGPMFRNFKGKLDIDYSVYSLEKFSEHDAFQGFLDSLGLGPDSSERIAVHAFRMQDGGLERLLQGNKLTQEQIDAVVLTPAEEQAYQFMRMKLDSMRKDVEDTLRIIYNKELGTERNYFPFHGDPDAVEALSIENRVFGGVNDFTGKTKKTELGFTKERTEAVRPLRLDAFAVYGDHLDDVLYFKHLGRDIKMLFEIANSPEFKAAAGDRMQEWATDWLDLMARKGGVGGATQIRVLDWLRRNAGFAALGFKISSAVIQVSTLMDAAGWLGPHVFLSAERIMANKEFRQFIIDHMPEIRDRVGDDPAFLDGAKEGTKLRHIQELSYMPLAMLDRFVAMSTAWEAYTKRLNELGIPLDLKYPNPDAVAYAQMIVRRSQASQIFKDVPLAISRGKLTGIRSFDQALLQFTNFVLTQWSVLRHDVIRSSFGWGKKGREYGSESMPDIKDKHFLRGFNYIFWILMSSMAAVGLRRGSQYLQDLITGRDNGADDGFTKQVALDFLTKIPFVSQVVGVMVYGGEVIPSADSVTKMITGVGEVATAKTTSAKERAWIKIFESSLVFAGLPGGGQIGQLLRGAINQPTPAKIPGGRFSVPGAVKTKGRFGIPKTTGGGASRFGIPK